MPARRVNNEVQPLCFIKLVNGHHEAILVAWLCLPGADSITGQAIVLAGGEVM